MNRVLSMLVLATLAQSIQAISFKEYYLNNLENVDQQLAKGSLNLINKGLTDLESFDPEHVPYFANLKELYLYDNQLATLPKALEGMTQLQRLDVSNNQLTELPAWICKLTELQSLNLGGNNLTEIATCVTKLPALDNLWVYNNPLPGTTTYQRELIGLPERVKFYFKTPAEERMEKALFEAKKTNDDQAVEKLVATIKTMKTPLLKIKDASKIRDESGKNPFD